MRNITDALVSISCSTLDFLLCNTAFQDGGIRDNAYWNVTAYFLTFLRLPVSNAPCLLSLTGKPLDPHRKAPVRGENAGAVLR